MSDQITIVKRETIPPLSGPEAATAYGAGELRDFRWNEQLRAFMPEASDLSVTWVRLGPGERLDPRAFRVDSMLVVYGGSADIVGDVARAVAAEDVVLMPSGCKHGFVGGPQGLFALAIQLGQATHAEDPAPSSGIENTLESLLLYNATRLDEFHRRPIFDLWAGDILNDPLCLAAYREALKLWISQSAALLFARQSGCADPKFSSTFLAQTVEQIGRGMLVDPALARISSGKARDPVLLAFADWFTRQMYVLDNVEKVAVVDLVVTSANAALGRGDAGCRFWAHNHPSRGAEIATLLRGETPRTYARLHALVAEAWDMISAMTDRVVQLTEAAARR